MEYRRYILISLRNSSLKVNGSPTVIPVPTIYPQPLQTKGKRLLRRLEMPSHNDDPIYCNISINILQPYSLFHKLAYQIINPN
jgi:hypothetical protein